MHQRLLGSAALALALAAGPSGAASVEKLFAFGDSLNDCCRNPAAPFTNGPETWLPAFADAIGAEYAEDLDHNYAVGGAQTGPVNAVIGADEDLGYPTGFTSQAARFAEAAPATGDHDLGVIWVSTNDIWATAYGGDLLFDFVPFNRPVGTQAPVEVFVDYVTDTMRGGIEDLVAGGIEKLLILTPYDMGQAALWDTPEAQALNTQYALALGDALGHLYTPGVETWVLDMVVVLEEAQAEVFAFDTALESCTTLDNLPDCDGHAFLDAVHFTTAMNSIIATEAADLVLNGTPVAPKPVPLPAGALLILSALGGLAVLRRRA